MARMTEEEAWALDDEVTRNPPDVAGITGGFFTERARRREVQTVEVDRLTIQWLRAKAEATHKTPAEIISELVRKELASA
ncbi:hypothetical protein AGMMS49942_19150 [Spirochaetia bacterium]|nr:hypothetical protein AGMMS49942_19150 [Spirochaetia bacterium]